ncbi:hypothetical protein [Bacillus sp. B1-b2]|uniref:hypothetical protein n=1 Tax=Bacillus sp. B1-b2 TaxID=2653201 RepID=UPI00186A801E|nr:hypothetical protein [Bacillus sp. B1-b2]
MINTRHQRLQELEEEKVIIRSFYERFWPEMSQQQQDYLANIEHKVVKEIRMLERQLKS